MHRIDSTNAVNGRFVTGNPVTGARPTIGSAEWHNDVQETLLNPIEKMGIAPQKGNPQQLSDALLLMMRRFLAVGSSVCIDAEIDGGEIDEDDPNATPPQLCMAISVDDEITWEYLATALAEFDDIDSGEI